MNKKKYHIVVNTLLSIVLILSLVVTGCTKEEEPEPENEDHTVIVIEIQDNEPEDNEEEEPEDKSKIDEDIYNEYPYNLENAEDITGDVYMDNLIASRDWGATETDELAEFVMQEVPDGSIELKALVALVVLNRVWTDNFPRTIVEVTVKMQREQGITYEYVEPDNDCYKAISIIQYDGWNESQDALYFVSIDNTEVKNYYDARHQELFEYEGYEFYK